MTLVPTDDAAIAGTATDDAARNADAVRRRTSRPTPVLAALSTAVAALVLLPLVFLVLQARQAGWDEVRALLFRHLTLVLLRNTIELAVLVTTACVLIGVTAAWLVERTNLPGRRAWAVLLVLPFAVPDFVTGYAWSSIFPAVHGLWGATLVMTLGLYPLVYLPVAAALRGTDPAPEEVARSLGRGRIHTFVRVTVPMLRPALLGGGLVVCLTLFAEYGAFEILRFQTFTTTIFAEFQVGFNGPAASALSLALVALGLMVLATEGLLAGRGRGRFATGSRQAARVPHRHRLERWTAPALGGLVGLVALALGMPAAALSYWMVQSHATTLPGGSMLGAAAHTAVYSASAAALATILALPVALYTVRRDSRAAAVLQRTTLVVQALPGLIIALAAVFYAIHYAPWIYQTPQLLVIAYAILFYPLAFVAVRASVAQAPHRLEEVARSLGHRPASVLVRVTVPLVAPGLAAAFCLVFLTTVTELTATLVLVPTGVHTLATQFWAYQNDASYGAAAPYAVALVAIAAVPSYLIGRWFDRLPSRQGG
ncbi:MAG TPA: iron ABC transporter permease [Micromonosporaceae bacterium]|nr:iron ABC transporter permease [Micromonosporaceae bacterium]